VKLEKLLPIVIGGILVVVAFFAGARWEAGDAESSADAVDVIEESYFREVDSDELENASIAGMVERLRKQYKDRFSHYFNPEAFKQFKQVTEGQFSGVGLTVSEIKQGLRVSTVLPDSPAKEAGIREQDIVTAVEGKSIAGQSAELATAEIKGEPGTKVTITVLRPSSGESKDYTLTRRELTVPAVDGSLKEADGNKVGYIRLLAFSRGAHAELRSEVDKLTKRGAEGLVIDLRGNGGGLLDEAVLTSSVFVEDGVIVSTEGRTQPDQTFEAEGDAVAPRPTVVLINGDTASASEIFTAALQEAGLAKVAGETSFGKGVFQEVIELDNGGALDLTVGEYLTRDGTSLAEKGIEPELPAVDVPETKPDEGLQQALQALGAEL
jgi:carboxyl-terminal processing protease